MVGHRSRLRDRFLASGFSGFLDYEIVELLLTLGTPRRDCKLTAKEAIRVFKGLNSVLDASVDELQRIKGIGPSNAFGIKLFQEVSSKYSEGKITPSDILNTPKQIFDFLQGKIGREKKEHFIILYFDTKNKLIYDDVSIGTLNSSLVHPREIFRKAIANNASHVVLAHNHPSGDPTPSNDDIETTRRLIEAGKIIGISIIDHIIICSTDFFSLSEAQLM